MARNSDPTRPGRNTAPMWKKIAVVLAAPISAFIVVRVLNATTWNFFLFLIVVIACAVVAVWGTAKLLGVHLSLSSWD